MSLYSSCSWVSSSIVVEMMVSILIIIILHTKGHKYLFAPSRIKTKSKCHTIISSGLSLYGVSCMKWCGEVCYRTKRHYRYPTATVVSVYDSHPIFDYLGINKHTSAISSTLSNNSCSQNIKTWKMLPQHCPTFGVLTAGGKIPNWQSRQQRCP